MARKLKDSGIAWIGMIPEEWRTIEMKRVVSLRNEKTNDSNLPYIGLENIESQSGKLVSSNTITPEENASKYFEGDILYGKLRPYLAKCILTENIGKCSSELLVLVTKKIANHYLHKILLSPNFVDLVNSSTYGTKMPRANWDFISHCKLPIPTLTEQEIIASWLDKKCGEIDELIDVEQKMIDELEAYRQATITETVTHGLNLDVPMCQTGVRWIPEIPEHWKKDKILRIFDYFGSGTTPKGGAYLVDEGGVPWINSGELNFGFLYNVKKQIDPIALKELPALKLYPINTIIIAMYGASIGKIAISKIEGCTNQACLALVGNKKDTNLKYFFYQLYRVSKIL